MRWLQMLKPNPELDDLMRSTTRNVVGTVAGLYVAWHIIATVGYPAIFSPTIWITSLCMLGLVSLTLRLNEKYYLLSQSVFLVGLTAAIVITYANFHYPAILFMLPLVPLIAIVTMGTPATVVSVLANTSIMLIIARLDGLSSLTVTGISLASVFSAVFGRGVSTNLLTALNAASYHYGEARRLLDETRKHRAEISRMLKDRNQVNYQLERMNEMLTVARAQADEARENRNRFMLAVSHELRSPLNFIIGFSDLMVNAPETYAPLDGWPTGLYDDVQEIYTSSRHLMRLINDILDMGKIEAGQAPLYREKAEIDQVIEDVRTMLSSAFEQKGIALHIDVPASLPSIFVDTTRIRQVLLNLLNNGLRFTDQGHVNLRVEKRAHELYISVRDTGTGIAPEDLPQVFSMFRQVGEENWRRRAGTGLGLYISRQFIELHGGQMDVESTSGEGTCFYFTLPLNSPIPDLPQLRESPRPADKDNRLVLLVSPSPDDGRIFQHELEGYTLKLLADVEQVASQTGDLYPCAVLVAADAGALQAEKLPYDLPVIRYSLPHAGGHPANVRSQLVKPVPRETLMEAIHALGADRHRLMVVDDDPAMVRFVAQSLRAGKSPAEYTLLTAFDAAQATALLEEHPVDAILLDLELPDVNGWEWLRQIQENPHWADIPVIIISAQDLPEMNFVPGTNAMELVLRRSLRVPELSRMVRAVLENIQPQYPQAAR
ncbi:MAG: response regulator [Anaerolineales bacterium]|nr:response regulator [Anaerolineales bacterium]